jgi:tRNA adenylyltransferase (EC 2.7.7.25)
MSWSDDKSIILLMLTLEQLELPPYELHKGPYVDSEAVENFVRKYVNDPSVIGPFIGGSRWYVIRSRKILNAIDAIKHIIPMVSLKNLKNSISRVEYITIKSLDDLTTLSPNERGVVEEFIYARPWWLT